jgi:hypothetical protein
MKAPWETPDSWIWRMLTCGSCGRTTYRPPLSVRPCGCGGLLAERRTMLDGVHDVFADELAVA